MINLKNLIIGACMCVAFASCTAYESHLVTGNPVGKKTGVAKSKIFGSSDISIMRAAKNGKIDKIATVDIVTKVFIFPITTVTVTGE